MGGVRGGGGGGAVEAKGSACFLMELHLAKVKRQSFYADHCLRTFHKTGGSRML